MPYLLLLSGLASQKIAIDLLFLDEGFENAYKELDLIHNGGEVMDEYANLSKIEDMELKKRYRKSLWEYCKLDTLAMVRVLDKLKECLR